MLHTTNNSNRYHLRAVRLPAGDQPEDWWMVDGRWSSESVDNATELPGRYLLPGLVDAHTHLCMDFNQTGLPPGSDALIAANLAIHLASGVTVVRDAGRLPNVQFDQPVWWPVGWPLCGPLAGDSGDWVVESTDGKEPPPEDGAATGDSGDEQLKGKGKPGRGLIQ